MERIHKTTHITKRIFLKTLKHFGEKVPTLKNNLEKVLLKCTLSKFISLCFLSLSELIVLFICIHQNNNESLTSPKTASAEKTFALLFIADVIFSSNWLK
jgi:hypothetical protein